MLAESDSLDEIVEMSFYNQSNAILSLRHTFPQSLWKLLLKSQKRKMTFGTLLYDVFRSYVDENGDSDGFEESK